MTPILESFPKVRIQHSSNTHCEHDAQQTITINCRSRWQSVKTFCPAEYPLVYGFPLERLFDLGHISGLWFGTTLVNSLSKATSKLQTL